MTGNQIVKLNSEAKGERQWWFDLCRKLAGEHWIDAIAEESFRRWLTPYAAAERMRAA